MRKYKIILLVVITILCGSTSAVFAQDVTVTIYSNQDKKPVSPYIYGKNNSFSNSFGTATTSEKITFLKESGLKFSRENSGNNATKYNWRKKISSHPDWYNNVYDHDWDKLSQLIQAYMPDMQVMWAFQLLGKVAANKNNNFNDWAYNNSQWWNGVNQNLAGGGVMNTSGGNKALTDGNPDLYLMSWPADSTTGILNHWFGTNGIGLNKNKLQYWSMDNEPEIWNGTHDDVMPVQMAASVFMDKYIEVAKKARTLFPEIKITGPVCANEWQWYKWGAESIKINGKYYCWLEYFLKRIADEQKATGIRLLDIVDIHWYPGESADADVVQLHRVFYDKNYIYPGANGVKTITGGWDNSQTKEYIFQRITDWLNLHFGVGHGIKIGMSESGINSENPNVNSVLYASMLGTFSNNDVELFTPWSWKTGMWETLHLFSRYAKSNSIKSVSTNETTVSAYSTINNQSDSMTIMLVNRDLTTSKKVSVNLNDFRVSDGNYNTLGLASLPSTETFKSHTDNALIKVTITVNMNSFSIDLPPLSTTAILLNQVPNGVFSTEIKNQGICIYPNPASKKLYIKMNSSGAENTEIRIFDQCGKELKSISQSFDGPENISINTESLASGIYHLTLKNNGYNSSGSFTIL